jgi:acetyl-CoA carboxylase carboxyltransferase component
MGLEGAVRLAMKKQLEAIEDPAKRDELFAHLVAQAYERGKAINMASYLEIDGVIDPADTRAWILRGLKSVPRVEEPPRRKRMIDPW